MSDQLPVRVCVHEQKALTLYSIVGQTTNQKQIASLAKKGFVAETDEDSHRAVLNAASAGGAKGANQKIVDNTPIVLNGLQSIMNNPSMANTMKNLQKIESARLVISQINAYEIVAFFFFFQF